MFPLDRETSSAWAKHVRSICFLAKSKHVLALQVRIRSCQTVHSLNLSCPQALTRLCYLEK